MSFRDHAFVASYFIMLFGHAYAWDHYNSEVSLVCAFVGGVVWFYRISVPR